MPLTFAAPTADAIAVHAIDQDNLDNWVQDQPANVAHWVKANGFKAVSGQVLIIPRSDATVQMVLAGLGTSTRRARNRFTLAAAAGSLPDGTYQLVSDLGGQALETEALGWLLSSYTFDRYAKQKGSAARLIAPDGVDVAKVEAWAAAETLTRDLINTPSCDMGPQELENAARQLSDANRADITVIEDADLLDQNFPMIHAVGRASPRAPRLIDMRWGDTGPKLTLVGKGVCFDTGGLNLKPGGSMALMKKDMGGAANVLGLAHMIMTLGLPVQLRVLIPAVENAVSGSAFRPGDILKARNGLTVEINNTDAEGRLVLADALALAAEDAPDQIISMATLTGAARVAVGPDLAPFYTDDDMAARALSDGGATSADPVWRMPLHTPYEAMIEPGIADLDNAPGGGFAGSITAALFLRRFVGEHNYMHFDIYGWNPTKAPGQPKGGAGQGCRALLKALPEMLNL